MLLPLILFLTRNLQLVVGLVSTSCSWSGRIQRFLLVHGRIEQIRWVHIQKRFLSRTALLLVQLDVWLRTLSLGDLLGFLVLLAQVFQLLCQILLLLLLLTIYRINWHLLRAWLLKTWGRAGTDDLMKRLTWVGDLKSLVISQCNLLLLQELLKTEVTLKQKLWLLLQHFKVSERQDEVEVEIPQNVSNWNVLTLNELLLRSQTFLLICEVGFPYVSVVKLQVEISLGLLAQRSWEVLSFGVFLTLQSDCKIFVKMILEFPKINYSLDLFAQTLYL